jgi:hypothetical protein
VGVRHALFPDGTALGALAFAGRVLPDATLRGMRMFRSHGGTVPTVSGWDLLSEASPPGSVVSCRRRLAKRGADTPAIFHFASAPVPQGRLRLLAGRWPCVTGLTSYLSGCIRFCSGVIPLGGTAPVEEVDGLCRARSLPAFASPLRAPPF